MRHGKGERKSESRISSVDLYANIFATVIFAHFAGPCRERSTGRRVGQTVGQDVTQHRKVGLLWIAPV